MVPPDLLDSGGRRLLRQCPQKIGDVGPAAIAPVTPTRAVPKMMKYFGKPAGPGRTSWHLRNQSLRSQAASGVDRPPPAGLTASNCFRPAAADLSASDAALRGYSSCPRRSARR